MDIEVLWDDENIVAVNKPSGLLTIPDGYHPEYPCAVDLLQKRYGQMWVVHRLDKETSGVLLFARNAPIYKYLNDQFQNRLIYKIYRALIVGSPHWEHQDIKYPLTIDGDRKHRTRANLPGGKPAQTDVTILSRFPGYCLVEARPHTGYTHQIRSHLSALGFPIITDPLYDQDAARHRHILPRLGLHAFQLSVQLPGWVEPKKIGAAYPADFQAALDLLSQLNTSSCHL